MKEDIFLKEDYLFVNQRITYVKKNVYSKSRRERQTSITMKKKWKKWVTDTLLKIFPQLLSCLKILFGNIFLRQHGISMNIYIHKIL